MKSFRVYMQLLPKEVEPGVFEACLSLQGYVQANTESEAMQFAKQIVKNPIIEERKS